MPYCFCDAGNGRLKDSFGELNLGRMMELGDLLVFVQQVVGWPLAPSGEAEGQCLMVLRFLREMRLVGKVNTKGLAYRLVARPSTHA